MSVLQTMVDALTTAPTTWVLLYAPADQATDCLATNETAKVFRIKINCSKCNGAFVLYGWCWL